MHYIDGCTGVKDLDVWTFYAAIPGSRFPADIVTIRQDFGPSTLGDSCMTSMPRPVSVDAASGSVGRTTPAGESIL
jgi:hypothetical protein